MRENLTRTKQVCVTRRCRLNIGSAVEFFKGHRVLHAKEKSAEKHVSVVGIGFDLQGAHHDIDETGFELAEGDDSEGTKKIPISQLKFQTIYRF
jgi:hypothetical protein